MKLLTILIVVVLLIGACKKVQSPLSLKTRGGKTDVQAVLCSAKETKNSSLIEMAKRISQESLQLAAIQKGQSILIDWSIKKNQQTKGFILEKRSKEGNYKTIKTINDDLEGTFKHYSSWDHFPSNETMFYRLKQLYKDGTTALSPPIKIEPTNIKESWFFVKRLEIEPSLQIEFNLNATQFPVLLSWYNELGTKLGTQQIYQSQVKLDLPNWATDGGVLGMATADQKVAIHPF